MKKGKSLVRLNAMKRKKFDPSEHAAILNKHFVAVKCKPYVHWAPVITLHVGEWIS